MNDIEIKIKDHAMLCYPEEACGLIVDQKEVFICKNVAPNKFHSYEINPIDYVKASRSGLITAIYHSHVERENFGFSYRDILNSENHKVDMILYDYCCDLFSYYSPRGVLPKYIGRKFKMGESDCFTLVQDYYKNELNIELKNYFNDRGEGFFNKNRKGLLFSDFLKMAEEQNLSPVGNNDARNGDILCVRTEKIISHLGIYLRGDYVLEQYRNSVSTINKLTEERKQNVMLTLRHKSRL